MSDPAPHPDRRGSGGLSAGARRVLAGVFTFAAVGSLLLVAMDLAVGRAAAGDVFIVLLNSLAAVVFWRWSAQSRGT